MLVFFIVSLVAFSIVRLTPSSPVDVALAKLGLPKTPENVAVLTERFGLDKPLAVQYLNWMKDFLTGQWGKSFVTQGTMTDEILRRLPLSVGIGLGGTFLAMFLSFILGYKASLKDRGVYNYISKVLTLGSQSIPVFILIMVTIYFLGVKLQLIKFFSGVSPASFVLATVFVAFPMIGPMSRTVRVHFKETAEEPFMKYYKYRGYDEKKALLRYGSRPAMYGLCSVAVSKFASVIGGATVVEVAMAMPGIGNFLVESIADRDYPMVQTYILILVIWMFIVNLIFEFIMGRILKGGRL